MAEPDENPTTEPFSASYALVHDADVITWPDEKAIMDDHMFVTLARKFGEPVVGRIGKIHYNFLPEHGIPKFSVAVPEVNHDNPSRLLIQK
jgi:hypothetical protein